MKLKSLCHQLIHTGSAENVPEILSRFRILCPEYSPCDEERKPWPVSGNEHLFALLWELHDGRALSATLLPREAPFTYEADYIPTPRTQMHSHEYLELFYIIDGEYRQKIMDNEFTFSRGELCLIDRNCMHQEILDGTSATILFLGITPDIFDDVMKTRLDTSGITAFLSMALLEQKNVQQYLHFHPRQEGGTAQENPGNDMEQALESLLRELLRHDEASQIICQGLLLRVFRLLSTQYEFSLSKKLKKEMTWILFEEISRFIDRHLQDISIRMLSEEFHFQDDYFNRLLKNQTGLTYTEYLQARRLERAESLLRDTDMKIDDIACEVGYHNKGYFYKIFAERHRLTPAQFRKKMKH